MPERLVYEGCGVAVGRGKVRPSSLIAIRNSVPGARKRFNNSLLKGLWRFLFCRNMCDSDGVLSRLQVNMIGLF